MATSDMQLLWALLCTTIAVSNAAFFSTYPVQWSTVPVPGDTTSKNLTANCICATRQGVCNTGCCCDPACVTSVVNATTSAGQCLPAGPPDETLNYCVPSSSVQKVNLPSNGDFYDISVQSANNQFLDQLLCITSSSSPALGNSYPDPAFGDVDNNAALASCQKTSTPPAMPTSYLYNTPVLASIGGGVKAPLTLPYPVFSQSCNDQFQVGFFTSTPDGSKDQYVSCVRSTRDEMTGNSTLPTLCTSQGMSIATYASMSIYSTPNSASPVPVTVVGIQYLDPTTGVLWPLPNDATTWYNNSVCYNHVVAVDMLFYYNWQVSTSSGTLAQVAVSLVVTNAVNSGSWLKQQTRVVWAQYQVAGSDVLFSYSGNPGYLTGFPVLAGAKASLDTSGSSKVAISRYTSGMPMPTAYSNGMCAGASQQPVRFGYNATSTCHVELNAYQLGAYCANNASTPAGYLGLFLDGVMDTVAQSNLWFGVWGNSNTSNVAAEWVKVQISNWPPNTLVAGDRSCSNVVVGYDLEILTGVAFSANNLQSKVLYANLCLRTATWTFPSTQDAGTPAKFYMTSTVTFISKDQTMDTSQQKPAPPLMAPLPEDIFYPFITSSAGLPHVTIPAVVLVAVLAALAQRFAFQEL